MMLKRLAYWGSLVLLAIVTHIVISRISGQRLHAGYTVPLCRLSINTLSASYNQNTDRCYYTVDMDCDGNGSYACNQCYVVHLWRQDVNSNWTVVYAKCYDALLDCGGNIHDASGVDPSYGPGPYWFQVDVWAGACEGMGGLLDSTWTTFSRN